MIWGALLRLYWVGVFLDLDLDPDVEESEWVGERQEEGLS